MFVFSVFLALHLPRMGKKELILVLFLFDLCLFVVVCFLFLLVSVKGCGLWLWHSLNFSFTFFVCNLLPWRSIHVRKTVSMCHWLRQYVVSFHRLSHFSFAGVNWQIPNFFFTFWHHMGHIRSRYFPFANVPYECNVLTHNLFPTHGHFYCMYIFCYR